MSKTEKAEPLKGELILGGNGIELDAYEVDKAPANEVPRAFFMQTGDNPFGGSDKVVKLAQQFPGWQFDVVGDQQNLRDSFVVAICRSF